ncbi:zinc-ribbon domain-containing protein [Sphingomonas panacisoli]|uniref:Zinc-ribbon domain-containing protein n=1 Tax=Sphingomonas panacisoli TaxID=1813879 RepID=A0A5B8LED4_9SPHN|nr:zinc ribbon domain-containing protein [Sphingomonas panacisoli]QDZ06431.1 zinc-ribbon domain-containing protein [Sphingomonas panacisoli]
MFCSQCGKGIEDDSRFCRWCGAVQVPRTVDSRKTLASDVVGSAAPDDLAPIKPWWKKEPVIAIAAVVALIVLVSIFSNGGSKSSGFDSTISSDTANLTATGDGPAPKPSTPNANWDYSSDVDKVRGGTTFYATTTSTNSISQSAPYDGLTTMSLMVRKSPAYGTDVLLTISSGQMMCPSYEGCSGTVRFDDGKAQRISFNGPADSSSEVVFVVGAKAFLEKLKKAKKVVIEKTLYQAGSPQFEFDVAGLKWDH